MLGKDGLQASVGQRAVGMACSVRIVSDPLVPVVSDGVFSQTVEDLPLIGWNRNR